MTGCITTAGNHLIDVTPIPGNVRPPLEQTVGDFSFNLDGGKMVTSNKMGRELNDEILGRWEKSGLIADHKYVKSSEFSESSVFRLTLSGHQEGESSIFLQTISGLTLTLIPYSVNSKMDLSYSLRNAESGCVFNAIASDSFNTIIGLLLLPISPFTQGGRTRTYDRIANNLYSQLATQGAFQEQAACANSVPLAVVPTESTTTAPSESTTAVPRESTTAERLRDLEKLKVEGLISDMEYQQKREQILGDL